MAAESMAPVPEEVPVLVVGGGPAGLTAATELRRRGVGRVLLLEREQQAGGIPRHSAHTGYALRDRHRLMTGPAYARLLAEEATAAGVDLRTEAMVTGWSADGVAEVTAPDGRLSVRAAAVILATGARERPRPARMVPGDRPGGVLTTGQLQGLVHLQHREVGTRAVIVGSELVSWSAVLTLREAGCRTVAMVTSSARIEAPAGVGAAARTALGFPVARRTRVARVVGRDRVEAVEVEHLDTGARTRIACDVVVFTGDWVPDSELARLRGLQEAGGHRGPLVDTALRTSAAGVFAVGNLVHPVDTADVAALDGRHVADPVLRWLEGPHHLDAGVRLRAGGPFAWVAPGLVRAGDPAPARGRLLLWPTEHRSWPRIVVEQDGRLLHRGRVAWPIAPGRMFRLPWSMLRGLRPEGGDVTIGVD